MPRRRSVTRQRRRRSPPVMISMPPIAFALNDVLNNAVKVGQPGQANKAVLAGQIQCDFSLARIWARLVGRSQSLKGAPLRKAPGFSPEPAGNARDRR